MNSFELEQAAARLCRRYDFLRVDAIGCSVLGRPLLQLTIGEGAKRVGFNAAHHANEWITTPLLLRFLAQYAAGVRDGDARYTQLYRRCTLDIVPMLNPDGADLVTGALGEGCPAYAQARAIAARFPHIPFPSGWKANIQGLDLNLAYPAQWERARQIKHAKGFCCPAPRDYPGPAPLAAVESAALYRRTIAADYQLVLAYHTQGRLIYWDFEGRGDYALAQKMGAASGYSVELPPAESSAAGYKDWFIQSFGRPGFTIEAGHGRNPLPLCQLNEMFHENLPILLLALHS